MESVLVRTSICHAIDGAPIDSWWYLIYSIGMRTLSLDTVQYKWCTASVLIKSSRGGSQGGREGTRNENGNSFSSYRLILLNLFSQTWVVWCNHFDRSSLIQLNCPVRLPMHWTLAWCSVNCKQAVVNSLMQQPRTIHIYLPSKGI